MEPRITEIKGGWAAVGRGWAVFALTETEARERYRAALRKHEEISKRPPLAQDPREEHHVTRP